MLHQSAKRFAMRGVGDVSAGAVSRVDVAIYDYAEHAGEALAWTPPKPDSPSGSLDGQLLYTHLKQSALFRGDAHSQWWGAFS